MNTLEEGAPTGYVLYADSPVGVTIRAESLPKYNLSFSFAPIRYPCVKIGGTIASLLNPLMYNLVVVFGFVRSIANQSIFSSVESIALGGMRCVINALLSFPNASFLNPSEIKES